MEIAKVRGKMIMMSVSFISLGAIVAGGIGLREFIVMPKVTRPSSAWAICALYRMSCGLTVITNVGVTCPGWMSGVLMWNYRWLGLDFCNDLIRIEWGLNTFLPRRRHNGCFYPLMPAKIPEVTLYHNAGHGPADIPSGSDCGFMNGLTARVSRRT